MSPLRHAIKDAGDADEIRTAWVSLGGDLVGLIPFGSLVTKAGGGKLAETVISFAIDQASDQVKDGVTESWASLKDKERASRTAQAEASQAAAQYALLLAMQEHGLMPDLPDATWAPGGEMLSWSDFTALSPGVQMQGIARMTDVENGVGSIFNADTFRDSYDDAFFTYYPK